MQTTQLQPGLIFASQTIPSVRSVSLGFWIRAGVAYEPDELQGVSHFLEHLLFKGTNRRTAREISEGFDNIGGELNAFTSKEYTCLYAKVVDDHLETAVDILVDMICHARLADEDVVKERNVILEEISMYEDSPGDHVHDLLAAALWPEHPLGRAILGTRESLAALDIASIRHCYHQYYQAPNMVVTAAGSLEHDQLAAWLQERLDFTETQLEPRRIEVSTKTTAQRCLVERPTEQLHLLLGFPGLGLLDRNIYAWNLLNNILGAGMSSRLFQSLREEHALVYSIYSYIASFQTAGYAALYLGLTPQNVAPALELISTELAQLVSNLVTEAELRRAKEQVKGSLIMGMESTANHMGRLGRGLLLRQRVQQVDEIIAQIESVTSQDVISLARRIFRREEMAVAAIGKVKKLPQALQLLTW